MNSTIVYKYYCKKEVLYEKVHKETINIDEDDIPEFIKEEQEEAMARNEAEGLK